MSMTADTWTEATPNLWMAGSRVFPRITVTGPTEEQALRELEERRAWWLALSDEDSDE